MTKNPFTNSLSATAYITAIASFMFFGKGLFPAKDNIFMPITMLSLLVLSVAMMSCFFFFQPIQLYLDGREKAGGRSFPENSRDIRRNDAVGTAIPNFFPVESYL